MHAHSILGHSHYPPSMCLFADILIIFFLARPIRLAVAQSAFANCNLVENGKLVYHKILSDSLILIKRPAMFEFICPGTLNGQSHTCDS